MREAIEHALRTDRTVDITTTGRHSGAPHRLEIWFHNLDGRVYLSGSPGPRDWYANLLANPNFTFHLKQSIQLDLPARTKPILAEPERRPLLERIAGRRRRPAELEQWVRRSPLVRVHFRSQ